MRLALLMLCATLATPLARADDNDEKRPSQAGTFLQAGVRLYDRAEFDSARDQLHRAETASDASTTEVIRAQVYLGMCAEQLGDSAQAERLFEQALALDPWAQVPGSASPKQRAQFASIRRHLYGNRIPEPPHRGGGQGKIRVVLPNGETSTSTTPEHKN